MQTLLLLLLLLLLLQLCLLGIFRAGHCEVVVRRLMKCCRGGLTTGLSNSPLLLLLQLLQEATACVGLC